MKEIVTNIAKMIKVKTFVTLTVIAIFAVLALRGDIAPDKVMTVVFMVIGFYFGTQAEKRTTTTANEGAETK